MVGWFGLVVCLFPAPHLWIDESPITLCQRARLQRGRTSFFIVLVPMNGRIKSATSLRHGRIQQVLSVACPCHPVDSRLRGNDGLSCYHPHPSPLPSRERGYCWLVLSAHSRPLASGLRTKSAMTGPGIGAPAYFTLRVLSAGK